MTRSRLGDGQWLWSVPIAAVLLLTVAVGWSYHWLTGALRERVGHTLQTVLRADVQALSLWLDAQAAAIRNAARQPGLLDASRALAALADRDADTLRRAPAALELARQLAITPENLHPDGYELLDPTGRVLAARDDRYVGRKVPIGPARIARLLKGEAVVEPPQRSPAYIRPALAVMTGIPCEDGRICAFLRYRHRADGALTRILNIARFGDTGETYAFNADGFLVSESRFVPQLRAIGLVAPGESGILNVDLRDPGVDLREGRPEGQTRASRPFIRPVQEGLAGRDGLDLDGHRDYRGVLCVGAWTWLARYDLGVISEVDAAEAYAPLAMMRRVLIGPLLLVVAAKLLAFALAFKAHKLRASLVRTESRAAQQDAIMRTVFDNIAEGVVVADDQGRFVLFNPAAARLSGIGRIEDPPSAWSAQYGVFQPDRVTPLPTDALPMMRALRGEAVDDVLVYVRNEKQPDGLFLSVSGRPLRDDAGRPAGASVVFRDVTEAREAEEANRRLNAELAQSVTELSVLNQDLESFSYSVSHDLRAPLRHIVGFVNLLKSRAGGALDETSTRHLGVIGDAAARMTTLIDDLLAFSRTGRSDMQRTRVDLESLAAEVIREVSVAAGTLRTIDWRIGPLPVVHGDRALLRIVLVNLLSNAVKYTQRRAHATIELGALAPGETDAGMHGVPDNGTQVVLFVRDNGVGFDMRYADKLFGVFQRLHKADEFEGTGIGLATVRRIIHRHGGRTWAEAAPDVGATFYVTLPLASTSSPRENIPHAGTRMV